MERAWLEQQLRQIRLHVALGKEHIARQQQIILDFEATGYDTTTARKLLKTFLEMQRLHEAHVERLT